jgi:hypothetical protein
VHPRYRSYRGLDDDVFPVTEARIETLTPPLASSQRADLLTIAVVATGAIVSSVAAVGAFLSKPW